MRRNRAALVAAESRISEIFSTRDYVAYKSDAIAPHSMAQLYLVSGFVLPKTSPVNPIPETETYMNPLRLVADSDQKKKSHRKKRRANHSFYQLLLDRVEHFSTEAQRVLNESDSDAIHQTRVYSRRTQSALEVLPEELEAQVEPLRRQLKRTRRAMNGIRDSDVFLEIVKKRLGLRKNKAPYELLREHFEARRKRAIDKMHERLKDLGLQEFPSRFIAAITDPDISMQVDGTSLRVELSSAARDDKAFEQSIRRAEENWQRVEAMIGEPKTFSDGEELHGLRIAIKHLRYIIELISQMKTTYSRSLIAYLKSMQDAIGEWHDLDELEIRITRFIGHPSFIRKELETSRALHGLITQLRGRKKRILAAAEPKLKSDRLETLMKKFLQQLKGTKDTPNTESSDSAAAG